MTRDIFSLSSFSLSSLSLSLFSLLKITSSSP
jgi:hypothetical protein